MSLFIVPFKTFGILESSYIDSAEVVSHVKERRTKLSLNIKKATVREKEAKKKKKQKSENEAKAYKQDKDI